MDDTQRSAVAQAIGQHTPGPWRVGNGHISDLFMGAETVLAKTSDGKDFVLAQLNVNDGCASIPADSRLIAAAPELLEQLRDAYNEFGPRTERGEVVPPHVFAEMTEEFIAKTWDFSYVFKVHAWAKAVAKAEGR